MKSIMPRLVKLYPSEAGKLRVEGFIYLELELMGAFFTFLIHYFALHSI